MILRHFGSVLMLVMAALPLGVSVVQAKSSDVRMSSAKTSAVSEADRKFQRDLQSLLGAPVQTKHGEMSLRQARDRFGRVRKQILVGRDFSEVKLDQNGDGTVDYWSVTQGQKSVVASEPNRGRFLRLEVSEHFAQGLQQSTYILTQNGRAYSLLKTRLVGNGVRVAAENASSAPTFEAIDANLRAKDESERVQMILDSGGQVTTLPASIVPAADDGRFSLVEGQWTKQQTEVFGDGLTCAETESGVGRLAALQREWWKVLKFEVDEKSDRLSAKLKASSMFADSCRDDAHKEEFERITKALSQVMLSSAKGDEWTSTNSRGRYLRCLEQSNLGVTAAEIERRFLDGMNSQYRAFPLFTCEFRPGSSTTAEFFPGKAQVSIYMTAEDEAKGNKEWDGSTDNYANILFHEMIHSTGFTDQADENLVHAAQACCGDPSAQRGAACNKLDLLVTKDSRYKSIESQISRGEVTAIQGSLSSSFGSEDAAKIYRGFIEGLDDYKRGSPPQGSYPDGLISGTEYAKCLKKQSDVACRAEWTTSIRAYADTFFSKNCKLLASGANRKTCAGISSEFKDKLANAVSASMITRVAPVVNSDPTALPSCPSKIGSTEPRNFRSLYSLLDIARAFLATEVRAADVAVDCGSEIPLPPAYTTPPACSTPECAPAPSIGLDPVGNLADLNATKGANVQGPADNGATSGTSQRPTDSVGTGGNSGGGGRVTTSPIPVQRVDTVADSRGFAEDSYRRATDFVGSSTRGLEDVRNAILPRAEAGDRARSKSDSRLGLKDDFVAFRPGESRTQAAQIDNPFSEKRTIASLADISKVKSGSRLGGSIGADKGSGASLISPNGVVASASSNLAGASGSGNQQAVAATEKSLNDGSAGGLRAGNSGRAMASVADSARTAHDSAAKRNVLEGLFSLPYREIEPRLNKLDVIEALISAKISIQDVKGRKVGSNRPREFYLFAGFDKPLKKQKD